MTTLWEIGFATYEEYLASDFWKEIRKRVFLARGRKCYLCGSVATLIHHLSYNKAVLLGNNLVPLIPLCWPCHDDIEFNCNGEKLSHSQSNRRYKRLREEALRVSKKPKKPKKPHKKYVHIRCKCGNYRKKNKPACRACLKKRRTR